MVLKVGDPKEFSTADLQMFLKLLIEQGKVQNATLQKIARCKLIAVCFFKSEMVSIGAIKPKTNSDFNIQKSNLEHLRDQFDLELGYCYTKDEYRGRGYSSEIANRLLGFTDMQNIMASTELRQDNGMVRILEKNGLKLYGQSWKSEIHGGALGLFLRFSN